MTADQYECTEYVTETTPDALIVSNLGEASWVLSEVEDREYYFYMRGGMGCTTPTGFGLAVSVDEEVVVLDGDGSLLMSLGCLSTIGEYAPSNLTVVVWNNEAYVTTGGQKASSADFAGVAESCGVSGYTATTVEEFQSAYSEASAENGPALVDCRVEQVESNRADLDFSHSFLKHRFRSAIHDDVRSSFG